MAVTCTLRGEAATMRLGAEFAACCRPGMRLHLRGELGSGKTSLARGLLRCLGCPGHIKSPTYTLVEEYSLPAGRIYHIDLYRIAAAEAAMEWPQLREYTESDAVCIIEWPERVGALLPPPHIEVMLSHIDSGHRHVKISSANAAWLRRLAAAAEKITRSV